MQLTNTEAEMALRRFLASEGYSVSKPRGQGETGVDLIAGRANKRLHIEVIGHSGKPPKRARDFFEAFFRSISRLKDGATSCVIAVPNHFGRGLSQRESQYGLAWNRIGQAFPELSVWLIYCKPKVFCVEANSWNDCATIRG